MFRIRRVVSSGNPKRRTLLALVLLVALISTTSSAGAATSSGGQVGLLVSGKANLSNPTKLAHAALSKTVFIFVNSDAITSISYFIDNPTGTGKPAAIAKSNPFVLSAGSTGYDTTALQDGVHNLLAVVTTGTQSVDLFARFEVKNVGAISAGSATTASGSMSTATKSAGTTARVATGAGAGGATGTGTGTGVGVGTGTGATTVNAPKITGITWKTDFENGMAGFKSTDWNREPKNIPGSEIVAAPAGGTGKALKYNLAAGNKRNENEPDIPNLQPGDEFYFQWQMFFPTDYQCGGGGWNIIMQWHGNDTTSPPLAMDVNGSCVMRVGGDGQDGPGADIGPVQKGKWTTYTLHAKFSEGNDGFVEAWENNVLKVPKTNRKTLNGGSDYLKMGIYRDPGGSPDQTIYFDNMVFGKGITK